MRPGRLFSRTLAALLATASACAVLACGSTSVTEVSGPTDVRCQTSLTANPQSVGHDGGSVTISVTTTRDCAWTSSSDASWIRLSTSSGQGEAVFTANVDANPQIVSRSGSVAVNGQRTSIAQTARPCTFDLGSTAAQFDGSGGAGRIDVTTIAGCSWRATTTASWIQVPPAAVTGSGGADFQVSANDGGARTGTITIADKAFVVTQSAAPPSPAPTPPPLPNCTAMVTPLTIDAGAVASSQTIQVVIGPTCAWSATSSAPWVTIASASSGMGTATITLAVAANTGAARSGMVTVAGQQVTVRQTALSCTFTLNPATQGLAAGGGSGRFTVTTQPGCAWAASKSVPWIELNSASGTGTGDVLFGVEANSTTAARSATITVAGQTFTVTQAAAACSYGLSAPSLNIAADGGPGRFTVTTSANCSWNAVAGAAWVSVSNPSGSGSADVNFTVQQNPATTARSTTITVGGQTFTINQAGAACTYTLNPPSANIAAAGSSGQFTVTTQAGCTWTAVPGAAWVTVSTPAGGSGTGTADVVYTVQANPDPTARATTIVAGGQVHTINQAAAAAPCTYALNPASGSFPATAGTGTFTVTTQPGCTWTATTVESWIALTAASGTDTGDVTFTFQANGTGAARSGVITVAGQTYTANQAP